MRKETLLTENEIITFHETSALSNHWHLGNRVELKCIAP